MSNDLQRFQLLPFTLILLIAKSNLSPPSDACLTLPAAIISSTYLRGNLTIDPRPAHCARKRVCTDPAPLPFLLPSPPSLAASDPLHCVRSSQTSTLGHMSAGQQDEGRYEIRLQGLGPQGMFPK